MMRVLKILLLLLGIAFFTSACGSSSGGDDGGGNSGSGGGSTGISYNGNTNQATVTDSNSDDLATGAYTIGDTGSELSMADSSGTHAGNNGQSGQSRVLMMSGALENAIHGIDFGQSTGGATVSTIISEVIDGDCGGSASYTIDVNDSTGVFSGSMNFNGYCSDDVIVTGGASFSGGLDTHDELLYFNFFFNDLTGSSGGESITMRGSIDCDYSSSTATVTTNILLRDNTSGNVYRTDNYVITFTDGGSYEDIRISGRYYDPVHGYVDISTPVPFRVYDTDDWPSSGVLLCQGSAGTAVRLTALSAVYYRIEADTDGDGLFDEYDTGPQPWSGM